VAAVVVKRSETTTKRRKEAESSSTCIHVEVYPETVYVAQGLTTCTRKTHATTECPRRDEQRYLWLPPLAIKSAEIMSCRSRYTGFAAGRWP
jgi:hypothetical protein